MTDRQLQIIDRLARTHDGQEFLEEVLKKEFADNHTGLLNCSREFRDEMVGAGVELLKLITLFETASKSLADRNNQTTPNLM